MLTTTALDCTRCVMTHQVDPELVVLDGVCNHCRRYDRLLASRVVAPKLRERQMSALVDAIKRAGKGNKYDCVVGVSGGVDSSYVALLATDLGLRPLAVHLDNGWNAEAAVSNIEKLLVALDLDLDTEVLDLHQFYDLQRSFLLASTPDADIPTDHAIQAALWERARKYGVRFVLSGMNFATESISVPSWSYGHSDWRYINSVHRRHGLVPLTTYPHYGLMSLLGTAVRRIRIVSLLNYVDYNKNEAVNQLTDRFGWQPYEGKHFESIYTRWVQGYYLPTKFGVDKRRGHYSDLINSGQVGREEALGLLANENYPARLRRLDEMLLMKKLKLSPTQLETIMHTEPQSFRNYANSYRRVQQLRVTVNFLRRHGLYPR